MAETTPPSNPPPPGSPPPDKSAPNTSVPSTSSTGATSASTTTSSAGSTSTGTTGASSTGASSTSSGGGDANSGGTTQTGGSALGNMLNNVGGTLLKIAVAGTRAILVPAAEAYTRETCKREDTGGTLLPCEREALLRAGSKLMWEVGTILTANHPVMPGGVPGGQKDVVEGQYPEPSIAYVFSAVKAASSFWAARATEKAEAARIAEVRARNEQQTPVPVSVLRSRRS